MTKALLGGNHRRSARYAAMLAAAFALPFERIAGRLIAPDPSIDFGTPLGEAAAASPDSVSWQVFRNPVTMFIGGVAAVLLELGEPRVRTAVWRHSSFRRDPATRLRRTGMAAMVTVYAARSRLEELTARVRDMHGRVAGTTEAGVPYRADDPDLLRWVQGSAAWAFLAAYRRYVRPVAAADRARYHTEGVFGGGLYGVLDVPASEAAIDALFADMTPQLEASPILHDLLDLVEVAPILPPPLRPMQYLVVRAAVDLLPPELGCRLGVARRGGLGRAEHALLRGLAATADRARFATSPATLACLRLGLPADYLLRRR